MGRCDCQWCIALGENNGAVSTMMEQVIIPVVQLLVVVVGTTVTVLFTLLKYVRRVLANGVGEQLADIRERISRLETLIEVLTKIVLDNHEKANP